MVLWEFVMAGFHNYSFNGWSVTCCGPAWHCDSVDNCSMHTAILKIYENILSYEIITPRMDSNKICHCNVDSKYNRYEWCCSYRETYYTLPPSHSSPGLYLDKSKFKQIFFGQSGNFISLGGGLLGKKVNKFLYSLYYCIVNKDEVVWERQEMIIKYSVKIS